MQVTETRSEGLKRAYKVVLPVSDLSTRLEGQLNDMRGKARINGFRPGKVPVSHLRKLYGKSVMAEIVQNAVNEVNRKILDDNGLRLAGEPKINFPEDKDEIEKALSAEGDLAYTVDLEVLPKFDIGVFDDVALERLVYAVPDADVDEAISRMAERARPFAAREAGAAAEKGDRVKIDFVGRIGGEAFEGGAGTDQELVLGSGSFIPGFEDQLVGAKAGDERKVTVTFPADYSAENLAGKEAVFDVTVKTVEAPGELKIDDEFAKGYGVEGLDKLKEAVRGNIEGEFTRVSREKLKRALLDALDKRYSFELPEGLVAQEFDGIWRQVVDEQKRANKTFADENTTEEAARADYRRIAERRVRLGLLLAEVGEKAEVKVSDEEVSAALVSRVRQFPGQEQAVWDYYRKNADALATIRAPLYEEKVVDYVISKCRVADKPVSKEELLKPDPDSEV